MALEGALTVTSLDELTGLEVRETMRAYPLQLGIMRPGEIASPEELEPGHPCWFSAPRFAKAAGVAMLERHPEAVGFDVVKVTDGHWRTVATEWREVF